MLVELRIRDYAIIESLTLSLAPGFNVLTGETGAGKSIIVGALGLLLGERASADLVRTGAERAVVEGAFDVHAGARDLSPLLEARGIEPDAETIVLRREISAAGRGRAWVNGTPVTATVLSEVGRRLVDLHGQHEAQGLLDTDSQRAILDVFSGAVPQAIEVRTARDDVQVLKQRIAELRTRMAEAERRADYLRHVVGEISGASITVGEDVRLEEEARRLEHADELRALAASAASALESDDEGLLSRLAGLHHALARLERLDPSSTSLHELYASASDALESLARELTAYHEAIDLDPTRLAEVQARRDLIFRLTKKYGPTVEDVLESLRRAQEELDLVDGGSLDIQELETRRDAADRRLRSVAEALTERRKAGAESLARAVDALFPSLGMPDGRFEVRLLPRDDIGVGGAEDIEFAVALNIGHDARPLARVASGGELSRVMLALKTILARLDRVPTLVFDEVDAGIGGRVGWQVGETMRRVAEHHQVFAITHLAQIAARAHHHIHVRKSARGGVTTADVSVLDAADRISEIARLLGGDPERPESIEHARSLLNDPVIDADPAPTASSGERSRRRRR